MNLFQNNKNLFLIYGFFLLWIVFSAILSRIAPSTTVSLITVFFLLIITPGFSLSRIFRYSSDDLVEKIILTLSLGFAFNFLICAIAILTGLTIHALMIFYLSSLGIMFSASLLLDLFYPRSIEGNPVSLRRFLQLKNLPIIIIFLFSLVLFFNLITKGSDFWGDPIFHLSILRKAISGERLTMANLSFTKEIVFSGYNFPIWHVFGALLAKIQKMDIVSVWFLLPLPLFWITLVVWYYFLKQILASSYVAVITLFFFLVINIVKDGYIFSKLAVPDVLNQMILAPLILGLFLKFTFDLKANYKTLILSLLLMIFAAAIHGTQLFYLFVLMTFFAIFYGIISIWKKDFRSTFKRILLILLAQVLILILLAIYLQFNGSIFSTTWEQLLNFNKTPIYSIIGGIGFSFALSFFVLLPYIRANPRISFLASSFLVLPMVSLYPIQKFFLNIPNLGYIFIRRLPQNVTWKFIVWGLLLGFILLLLDRLVSRIKIRWGLVAINSSLVLTAAFLFFEEWTNHSFANNLGRLFNNINYDFWNGFKNYTLLFILILGSLSLLILIWQYFQPKISDFFRLNEPKNSLFAGLLALIFFLIFFPTWPGLKKAVNTNSPERVLALTNISQETRDYINQNVPSKSVFLASEKEEPYLQGMLYLAAFTDQYMVSYPRVNSPDFQGIFSNLSLDEKLKLITKGEIDYIVLTKNESSVLNEFKNQPLYFTEIFSSKDNQIFKIRKENLKNIDPKS